MSSIPFVPVITIDGPTASGKGTVSTRVAQALGWHVLDSGAIYRLTALACVQQDVETGDVDAVAKVAQHLDASFDAGNVYLSGKNVTEAIRDEQIGLLASKVAAYESVRAALLQRQRDFRQLPGLVGDGRDMGTVIFPDASLKVFLQASAEVRAQRRCKQLNEKGISANLASLTADLQARDEHDKNRAHAPLVAAVDAHVIDSSNLSIEETVAVVLDLWSRQNN